jgi:hypothetical protein
MFFFWAVQHGTVRDDVDDDDDDNDAVAYPTRQTRLEAGNIEADSTHQT